MDSRSVDLVVIDPPYLIKNTKAGGKSQLARSIQGMNNEIKEAGLTESYNLEVLDELMRVLKSPNIYIWCNKAQIPMYIEYFVTEKKCSFDILIWNKSNATPLFNNKYLSDKEYCMYFRKGARCQPQNYEDAKTVYCQPINIKDKRKYNHPTIKPLNIIENLIKNSTEEGQVVLDCFMGSGTTGEACVKTKRSFIGMELDENYFDIAKKRIDEAIKEQEAIEKFGYNPYQE